VIVSPANFLAFVMQLSHACYLTLLKIQNNLKAHLNGPYNPSLVTLFCTVILSLSFSFSFSFSFFTVIVLAATMLILCTENQIELLIFLGMGLFL